MWFDTILWLVAIVAFIAVETATTALVSVWFAIGAAAAMFASFFTSSLGIQAAVFAVVSAVALAIMVPTLTRRRKEHKPPVTNGSPLTIGKQGIVLVAIEPACRAVSVSMVWIGRPVPKLPSRRARVSA